MTTKRFAGLALLVAWLWCPAGTTAGAADPLRFGVLPVVDTLPLLAGEADGLFAAEGIDLEIVSFQSALERDAALQAGRLDGYFGDLLNTLLLIHVGEDLKVVTTVFRTHPEHRMFGIAASPGSGIRSMDGLRGRAVAISRSTVIEYLLDRLLAADGRPPDFLLKEEIKKIPIRLQMLLADQVPAALLPEPLLTLAEIRGASVVADDRRLGICETVLALRGADRNPQRTRRFLAAYGRAVSRVNADPEAHKALLIEKTRFPLPARERYRVPAFPPVGVPAAQEVADVEDWLLRKGLVTGRRPYEEVVHLP